jgi:hypothetical protein
MISPMAKRASNGGRPSKGPRDAMLTRLHPEVGQRVRVLAEEKDWTYSDTLEALICIGLDHLDELPDDVTTQQELPLTKAS